MPIELDLPTEFDTPTEPELPTEVEELSLSLAPERTKSDDGRDFEDAHGIGAHVRSRVDGAKTV